MSRIPCVVVGAGVIGIACSRAISKLGVPTLVIEANNSIGQEISSRNSEVIHSGIYYDSYSKKAKFCIHGQKLLYEYLISRGIPHKRCGKFIVATSLEQVTKLNNLYRQGLSNGVSDLQIVDEEFVSSREPQVSCVKAIWSPNTGVFDSASYMTHLHGDAEANGSDFVFQCSVRKVEVLGDKNHPNGSGFRLITSQGNIDCNFLVNASGLQSTYLARQVVGLDPAFVPKSYFAKGSYFKLNTNVKPFSHLIYPMPEEGGLGVHSTIDCSGAVRFGPDVEWLKEGLSNSSYEFNSMPPSNFEVDKERSESFYKEIRKYWRFLPDNSLVGDYAGIRPKLSSPAKSSEDKYDFVISQYLHHGVHGLVNLFGIESPGLTSSLAIADHVANIIIASSKD